MRKLILSLCDLTGTWSQPYAEREGEYEVIRYDIQRNGRAGDIRFIEKFKRPVHGIIAQPPCTHLAASGARWWRQKGDAALLDALALVDACLRVAAVNKAAWWVLENPVGRLHRFIGRPSLTVQPHEFAGHADDPAAEQYTKRTLLWGAFNTQLIRAELPPVLGSKLHRLSPSPQRQNLRSATPQGFARAFFNANP